MDGEQYGRVERRHLQLYTQAMGGLLAAIGREKFRTASRFRARQMQKCLLAAEAAQLDRDLRRAAQCIHSAWDALGEWKGAQPGVPRKPRGPGEQSQASEVRRKPPRLRLYGPRGRRRSRRQTTDQSDPLRLRPRVVEHAPPIRERNQDETLVSAGAKIFRSALMVAANETDRESTAFGNLEKVGWLVVVFGA